MKILALALILSTGSIEIRQLGSFDTQQECDRYLMKRVKARDLPKGVISCFPAHRVDEVFRNLFGTRT